jgi:hypothetical protein
MFKLPFSDTAASMRARETWCLPKSVTELSSSQPPSTKEISLSDVNGRQNRADFAKIIVFRVFFSELPLGIHALSALSDMERLLTDLLK